MTESSPQPESKPDTLTLDGVLKLLNSKLVSAGYSSALGAIAIDRASKGLWVEAGKFVGAAGLVWLTIRVANKLVPIIDKLIDDLFNRVGDGIGHSGTNKEINKFKQKYLEALKTYCYSLEVEGFRGNLPRLPLKEIFVPLRLDSDPDSNRTHKIINKIWDLLPKENNTQPQPINIRLAIIADPGYGKTTLTRYLTLSYADGSYKKEKAKDLIPILLLFRTIHTQIQNNYTPTLPDLITQQILNLPRCQNLKPVPEWLNNWLNSGECLVMLDGLDEVPQSQREKVSKWANWQMQAYNTPFILTSRPHGYDSSLFQGVQPAKIIDFNNHQKSNFIEQWYRNRIWAQWKLLYEGSLHKPEGERLTLEYVKAQSRTEAEEAAADLKRQLFANFAISELAKNPLLVTIIAASHEVFESLPKERTSLYRKIFHLLLESRPNRRETRLTMSEAEHNQAVLQPLALKSLEQEKLQFTPEQASHWIEAKLLEKSGESALTPKKFLREIQNIAGLLAGGTDEGGLYQFTHKTFQEYLAALELKEQGQENILIDQFYNPDWKEIIIFYTFLNNATPFLELVLHNLETSPDKEYALELAHRLVEGGGKVDEKMRQQLDKALKKVDLGCKLNAAISLKQKFRNLIPIDKQTAISEFISWGEYKLFLEDQASEKFHASAETTLIFPHQEIQPVTGRSDKEAQWFCAWLSTQLNLQSTELVYDYRLPSNKDMEKLARMGILSLNEVNSSDFLRVVRVEIPKHYQALLNYLANGRWLEADQETGNLMLELAGQKERGFLDYENIEKFPCEDLRIINQLWLKFSGNRFGFSVQKEIYESLGGTNVYDEKVFDKFYESVGWKKEGKWVSYKDYTFSLNEPKTYLNVPQAHFPYDVAYRRVIQASKLFFSRAKACNL